jgi:hypothetical protein
MRAKLGFFKERTQIDMSENVKEYGWAYETEGNRS